MAVLSLLGIVAIAIPAYFLLVTLYRLTFHPLAKYPGPLLWKISGWPDALTAMSGKRHLVHHQLHCKYGHIIRIGPNRLSWDTPQAFHDIHSNRNANVIKSGFVGFTRDMSDALHLQQMPGKYEHAQRRKIMASAFTDSALKSAESIMLTQIRTWMKTLLRGTDTSADGWSETKDLGKCTNLLTLDVFGELCFGENFKASEKGGNKLIDFLLSGAKMFHAMAYTPIDSLFVLLLSKEIFLKVLSRKAYDARWALRKELVVLIGKRQKAEADAEKNQTEFRKDIFHYVLKARDEEGKPLELKHYGAEATLLVAAGTDTTSTALAATLYYLNQNPDKLEKVRAEVDNAFKNVEEIQTGPTLSSLHYLRACIEESLRITPPVPGSLTRRTLPGGWTVENAPIPAGVDLEVPIYALTHNENIFPDPTSYLPERWIAGSKTPRFEVTEALVNKQRNAFVPFSTGSRNCVGMRLAYMEMGIVMARLLYLYDMRFDWEKQKTTKEFETEDWFVSTKKGPYLQFKSRVRSEKA